jgi:hypothetical protein
MKISLRGLSALFMAWAGAGCTSLPPELQPETVQKNCVQMNSKPLGPYGGDPHKGFKYVFACNVDRAIVQANTRPFPEGTRLVKQSTREGQSFVWLVATTIKQGGVWHWEEYTRNFADEDFQKLPLSQSVCTDCHTMAKSEDWIYTQYTFKE